MMARKFTHGWNPDRFDERDKIMHVGAQSPVALVDFVDLSTSQHMPPVWDQGDIGSCTAHSVGAAFDFDRHAQGFGFLAPSRLAIYYDERVMEGAVGSDAGAEIRDGIKVSVAGVGPEELWPYLQTNMFLAPTQAYRDACGNKSVTYQTVSQADYYIGYALQVLGRPVAFGFECFPALESDQVAETGILPMPSFRQSSIGGHAVCIVGRDAARDRYLVRNSWGPSWGLKGYFWMPRPYALNKRLASDFWVITGESVAPVVKAA